MSIINKSIIHQYIRNNKNAIIGVMVALKEDGQVYIGWSKCNKLDRFNKMRGLEIAIGRATMGSEAIPPRAVIEVLDEFRERADRYFNNPKKAVRV